MSANIANQVAYLRTSREFPEDSLPRECSKAYIDTANAVNVRTIGIFPVNVSAITGETWYFTSQKQQTLRRVYNVTSTASIPHSLNLSQIARFTRTYGNFTDGTNWYGLISASNVAIAGQISFYITPTNIVFLSGVGAPALTNGQVVLEWLAMV